MPELALQEGICQGFTRVARDSRAKIRDYLLKRVGLSSHDVRVMIDAQQPIEILKKPVSNIYATDTYRRKVRFSGFHVLNTSGTAPAICEFYIAVKAPKTSLVLSNLRTNIHDEESKGLSFMKSYLKVPSDESGDTYEIPRLLPGEVLFVSGDEFGLGIEWKQCFDTLETTYRDGEAEFKVDQSDVETYKEWQNKADRMQSFCDQVLEEVEVWVGIVLDSKELLPFKWNHSSEEFEQGFFYAAVTGQ